MSVFETFGDMEEQENVFLGHAWYRHGNKSSAGEKSKNLFPIYYINDIAY